MRTGTISYFFRDKKGIEKGIENVTTWGKSPKVWSAGCSIGQEPFTIAILLAEQFSNWQFSNTIIYATDIEPEFEERIKNGEYTESEVNAVITNKENMCLIKKYMKRSGTGQYTVIPELRRKVVFMMHDILTDGPIKSDFDMITCKNVFEYFSTGQKRKVYEMFCRALKPGGILVMDPKQRNPESEAPGNMFERLRVECPERIYRKRKNQLRVSLIDDSAFNRVSDYTWTNIEADGKRIGKARVMVDGQKIIVNSIMIYPEFEGNGYAREVIDFCKEKYDTILADKVRSTAMLFWEKMGFTDNKDGNYVWKKETTKLKPLKSLQAQRSS